MNAFPRPSNRANVLRMDNSSLPPGLPRLFDERSEPDFRSVFGLLVRRSTRVDVALTRLRLSALDLHAEEAAHVERIRLLLAEVNAVSLDVEAYAVLRDPARSASLTMLARQLGQGVIEVRAAPLAGWSPDFTVFGRRDGARAVLLGFHWLQRPFPHQGPALASLHGPREAALASQRFDQAWARAHDIRPAILGILQRAREAGARARHEAAIALRPQGISAAGPLRPQP
jgi:hypothetical protein